VAVVRLTRFARPALGRIAADLRLQLYDVDQWRQALFLDLAERYSN
jgi:hypothetical protein